MAISQKKLAIPSSKSRVRYGASEKFGGREMGACPGNKRGRAPDGGGVEATDELFLLGPCSSGAVKYRTKPTLPHNEHYQSLFTFISPELLPSPIPHEAITQRRRMYLVMKREK